MISIGKFYKPKFCEWCGKWFVPVKPNQRCCCRECAKQSAEHKDLLRRWRKLNPKNAVKKTQTPKEEPLIKKVELPPAATMDEVLKYMYEHNCQYRTAVLALDGNRY